MTLKSYFSIGIASLAILFGVNTVRASQISSERLGIDVNQEKGAFYTPFTEFASENSTVNATEKKIAVPIPLPTTILSLVSFVGLAIRLQQEKNS